MGIEIIARVECDDCSRVVKFEPSYGYHSYSGNSGSYNTEPEEIAKELESEVCEKWLIEEDGECLCESCVVKRFPLANYDEEEISQLFDEQVLPSLIESFNSIDGNQGKAFSDAPMLGEAFSNWLDGLDKDSKITAEQVQEFCYVGEFSHL